jgi:hypothetical protein
MRQPRNGLRLAFEPLPEFLPLGELCGQDLDGDQSLDEALRVAIGAQRLLMVA